MATMLLPRQKVDLLDLVKQQKAALAAQYRAICELRKELADTKIELLFNQLSKEQQRE